MIKPPDFSLDSVVMGRSPRMQAVFDFVHVIADSSSSVLVTGETGTGKELIANLIHYSSRRRHKPFVPVSCAILSETLIESELFGHERGAFTGAIRERLGRFESAQGGTIFLDDVDDIPVAVQVKLLRVLQTRTVERLGGSGGIPIDVRVITGTKRDLRQMVTERAFREDLFYRLNVLPITLPSLRDRSEDIPLFMEHFLRRACGERGHPSPGISRGAHEAFLRYPWPGNVRELENACERIAQTCTCGTVGIGCVPPSVLFHRAIEDPHSLPPMATHAPSTPLDAHLRGVEAKLIRWALDLSGGNKSKAADILQVKRSTLGDRIKKLAIDAHEESP